MGDNKVVTQNSKVTIKMNEVIRVVIIVEPAKVNASQGFISFESPLGQALMGCQAGISISFQIPQTGKTISVDIISIE